MITLEQGKNDGRMVCACIWMGVAMLCATTAVMAEGAFTHLTPAEIKKAVVGKAVTDGAHWRDTFKPDGTLESIMHGHVQKGRWRVGRGELCMAYPNGKGTAEECYEVWRQGHVLE